MSVVRHRPRGAAFPFGLAAAVFFLTPSSIGYQDIAALLVRQPDVSERWREHLRSSTFGTIHVATFSFPRPIGTVIPDSLAAALTDHGNLRDLVARARSQRATEEGTFQLASLSTADPSEVVGSIGPLGQGRAPSSTSQGPSVNRQAKGDFLGVKVAPAPGMPGIAEPATPALPVDAVQAGPPATAAATPALPDDLTDEERTIRLLFGSRGLGPRIGLFERWQPGEEPVLVLPRVPHALDTELALQDGRDSESVDSDNAPPGRTIAAKGEVTGDSQRPMSLAERLGLGTLARAKAERCLANAVYFESRGEPVRGQIAVAQVVMNRVFSGHYPQDVCGVVYQNAHRRLACQFTFACDGIADRINDQDAWTRAKTVARDVMDGKAWLPEIGKSTHYHAYWVRPWWTRSMNRLSKIGVHTFYRPRKWGDGAEAPAWGETTAAASKPNQL